MAGIKEVREVIDVAAKLGNAAGKILQDDKFDWGELVEFVPALIALPEAISGISLVGEELKDLSEEEKSQLAQYLVDQFDIPQDDLETAVEDHAAVLLELWMLVKKYYLK
jgi:hypothetical protein